MRRATVLARRPPRRAVAATADAGTSPSGFAYRCVAPAWTAGSIHLDEPAAGGGAAVQILAVDTFTRRVISGSYARLNPQLNWPSVLVFGSSSSSGDVQPRGNRCWRARLCIARPAIAIRGFPGCRIRRLQRRRAATFAKNSPRLYFRAPDRSASDLAIP